MMYFKLKDLVKVIDMGSDDEGSKYDGAHIYVGRIGAVEEISRDSFPVMVRFDDGDFHFFKFNELAHATEQPATAPTGTPSAFAQAAQGDNELAVALYEAAVLQTRVSELEAQLAAAEATAAGLRRERDAARRALDNIIVVMAGNDDVPDSLYNFARREQQQAADAKPAGGA